MLADRIDRLRLLLVTQILTALALTAAFVLAVLGQVARCRICWSLAVLSNTFRAFDEPSRLSLVPQLSSARACRTPSRSARSPGRRGA